MRDWLRIDTVESDKLRTERINGVKVQVSVSPYDIPRAVRGYKEPSSNHFVIEFRYLAEEPTKTIPSRDHVLLEVGEKSGRIYKIRIDVVALKCEAVGLEFVQETVDAAIDKLGALPPYNRSSERYNLPKTAIHNNSARLFAQCSSDNVGQ